MHQSLFFRNTSQLFFIIQLTYDRVKTFVHNFFVNVCGIPHLCSFLVVTLSFCFPCFSFGQVQSVKREYQQNSYGDSSDTMYQCSSTCSSPVHVKSLWADCWTWPYTCTHSSVVPLSEAVSSTTIRTSEPFPRPSFYHRWPLVDNSSSSSSHSHHHLHRHCSRSFNRSSSVFRLHLQVLYRKLKSRKTFGLFFVFYQNPIPSAIVFAYRVASTLVFSWKFWPSQQIGLWPVYTRFTVNS